MNAFLEEVQKALERHADPSAARVIQKYMSSKLEFFGLKVPLQRQIAKKGFSFYQKSEEEILKIWDSIWRTSKNFDVMSLPLFYYTSSGRSRNLGIWPTILAWTSKIENWAHSDYFSKIVADLLEEYPREILPQLRTWNRSTNPWERRQSIIGLLAFGGKGRKRVPPFAVMAGLVKRLLYDANPFVQKGVGWSLREIGEIYPNQTRAFIRRHIHSLSSIAFPSAIERWPPGPAEALKQLRKKERQTKNSS